MGCASSSPAQPTTVVAKEEAQASFFDKYTLGAKLGKGGFAQVRILLNTGDKALAVKIMDLRRADSDGRLMPDARYRKEAVEEAGAWRQAGQHANIVGLQDAFLEHGACFFVMEMCDQSFQSFLKAGAGDGDLTERFYSKVLKELLEGLAHVHSKNVVHRDLKPDNVMVSGGVCKLCDFGLAGVLPLSGNGLSGIYGTAPFMAPEMLNRLQYQTEVDVWSMGVLAYTLFFGDFPVIPEVKNSAEMKRIIKEGKILPTFKPKKRTSGKQLPDVSEVARQFVKTLLNRDQQGRISAAGTLELEFLTCPPVEKLSSLKSTLAFVMKCGAFENRRVDKFDEALDPLLQKLHRKHVGDDLTHSEWVAPKVKVNKSQGSSEDSTAASRRDSGDSSANVSVFSVATSMTSNATPNWKTDNMSVGGRHDSSCTMPGAPGTSSR